MSAASKACQQLVKLVSNLNLNGSSSGTALNLLNEIDHLGGSARDNDKRHAAGHLLPL
jgi:hypothetical protein